jgi:hypothetical protein
MSIEVRVRALFHRQNDIAPEAHPARLLRAAVGGLHDAGPASRHYSVISFSQLAAQRSRHLVIHMPWLKPCRTERRHAWAVDVAEEFKPLEKLQEDAYRTLQIGTAIAFARQN